MDSFLGLKQVKGQGCKQANNNARKRIPHEIIPSHNQLQVGLLTVIVPNLIPLNTSS